MRRSQNEWSGCGSDFYGSISVVLENSLQDFAPIIDFIPTRK
jgi:hypothetical protein